MIGQRRELLDCKHGGVLIGVPLEKRSEVVARLRRFREELSVKRKMVGS